MRIRQRSWRVCARVRAGKSAAWPRVECLNHCGLIVRVQAASRSLLLSLSVVVACPRRASFKRVLKRSSKLSRGIPRVKRKRNMRNLQLLLPFAVLRMKCHSKFTLLQRERTLRVRSFEQRLS